jgi:hypothetical protein
VVDPSAINGRVATRQGLTQLATAHPATQDSPLTNGQVAGRQGLKQFATRPPKVRDRVTTHQAVTTPLAVATAQTKTPHVTTHQAPSSLKPNITPTDRWRITQRLTQRQPIRRLERVNNSLQTIFGAHTHSPRLSPTTPSNQAHTLQPRVANTPTHFDFTHQGVKQEQPQNNTHKTGHHGYHGPFQSQFPATLIRLDKRRSIRLTKHHHGGAMPHDPTASNSTPTSVNDLTQCTPQHKFT